MQNMKIVFLVFLLLLVCTSCSGSENQEPVDMNEVLKIRTWLLDEELEGAGRWGYISLEEQMQDMSLADVGGGYWIPDDENMQVKNDDVFVYETLELGVPRTMAPLSMHMKRDNRDAIHYTNLVLDIEFEGLVKIVKIEPNDSSIQLRYSVNGSKMESDAISMQAPCNVEIYPFGKLVASEKWGFFSSRDTIVGKEYILQIQGCSMSGDPIVTAEVKLTAIPDPEYPWETVHEGEYIELYNKGEERTRFCSIELLSYTYSEMYILRGEAGAIE